MYKKFPKPQKFDNNFIKRFNPYHTRDKVLFQNCSIYNSVEVDLQHPLALEFFFSVDTLAAIQ